MADPDTSDREHVGLALGRIPSGIFVCSCGTGHDSVPFIASWVQQAAMDPPAVSVAIGASRSALPALDAGGGAFTLSILPVGGEAMMKPFFQPPGDGSPFGDLAIGTAPSGGIYLEHALGWLECSEVARAQAGSHVVIVGEIIAGRLTGDGTPIVHVRKTGFSY